MAARIPTRLTPAEGRKFAFTVGTAFLVLATVVAWRGHTPVAAALGSLGGALGLAGVLVPGRLSPVYRAWMGLARALSKVTTPIFMGIVFFGLILPVGLLRRRFGGNPVLRQSRADASFWVTRPAGSRRSDLERQF